MLRSGEMGSLSAGPGSPTASTDKALRQGELAPGASGARSRTRIAEPQAVLPLTDAGLQPRRRNLGRGASSGGAAGTRAPHRAEHYSDLSICQAKPEKTSWPVPSLEPDKIPPELQPDIPEASAEFHSLWIRSSVHSPGAVPHSSVPGHPAARGTIAAFQVAMHEAVQRLFPPQQGKPCCCKQHNSRSWLQ